MPQLIKVAEIEAYEAVFRAAFIDELQKVAQANGGIEPWSGELEKFASSALLDELVKEALVQQFGQMAGRVGSAVKGAFVGSQIPTGFMEGGKQVMLRKGGLFGGAMGAGKRMEQAGQAMRETMAQRVAKTGLKTSPTEMAGIQKSVGSMGRTDPGVAGRIAGHTVESTGAHIRHATPAGMVLKGVGVPIGGAMEGLTRGSGKELQRSGTAAVQRLGRGMEKVAPRVGQIGELGAVPLMATGLGIPITGAGLFGGQMLGAAAHAAPLLEGAIHAGGEFAHHLGGDVAGAMGAKGVAGVKHLAHRAVAPIQGAFGRLTGAAV